MGEYKTKGKLGKKRIVFITGTRADFAKIKSLINALDESGRFDVHIFATGMHMLSKYGYTINEIEKEKMPNIYKYINHSGNSSMESIMASTLIGFGNYIKEFKPDMVVVHGDRVEALAGALAGSFNNIRVAHIEGGEISGTIDEHIRHAVSKIAHIHFVANENAKRRLVQMGENPKDIFVTGSPDIDIMLSKNLPSINQAKKRYGIKYDRYGLLINHAVTTELDLLHEHINIITDIVIKSGLNYIVIHPNNDPGTDIIQNVYEKKFVSNPRFKTFPSIRFEYFLTFLKNADFIIGNSSAGIREAPYYGVPAINIGTRQNNRVQEIESVFNRNYQKEEILNLINNLSKRKTFKPIKIFGLGNSCKNFLKVLGKKDIWRRKIQKQFNDVRFI